MPEDSFDLLILGGGPGGYVAAIRGAQLGLSVGLVEEQHLGGICLNWGCIPTKALLRSAELFRNAKESKEYGLKTKGLEFDFKKIIERSRGVVAQLNAGVIHLLKKNKVTFVDGRGRLAGGGKISVEKDGKSIDEFSGKNIILATGARARALPGLEPDGKLIWSYKEAMTPGEMPNSLLVVGSGAIGMEFASFYATLGAEVTVVEVLPRVLPVEDAEISAFAHKAFEAQGMKIRTGATVTSLKKGKGQVTASIEKDGASEDLTVERVIMAVGIQGNVEDIGLEGTKITVDRTHIVTDEWSTTGEPGIFAIGDVAGPPWLAHKASHEGIICVERIAGLPGLHPLDKSRIPGCTYCHPQVASIGLTEEAAKEQGREVKIGHFPFMGNGKAIALGEAEGLVKTLFDAGTGELLGAHMVGAEVTELIQGFSIGMTLETTEAELMETIFPHPTLSEMMHEASLDAFGRVIHF